MSYSDINAGEGNYQHGELRSGAIRCSISQDFPGAAAELHSHFGNFSSMPPGAATGKRVSPCEALPRASQLCARSLRLGERLRAGALIPEGALGKETRSFRQEGLSSSVSIGAEPESGKIGSRHGEMRCLSGHETLGPGRSVLALQRSASGREPQFPPERSSFAS